MATVTHRLNHEDTVDAINFTSAAFTPAASELLVVYVSVSTTDATPTLTDSQSLGFTRLATASWFTSNTRRFHVFIANALAANSSMTVTYNGTATSGFALIDVLGVSGMSKSGSAAVLQQAQTNSISSITTPVVTFGATTLTSNPVVGAVCNGATPAGLTPPSGFTEDADYGGSTPNHGLETVHVNSGFTSTTVTWGNAAGTGGGAAIALELDSSGAGGVTYVAPRTVPSQDPARAFWAQKDRRDANAVGTAGFGFVQGVSAANNASPTTTAAFGVGTTTGNLIVVTCSDDSGVLGTVTNVTDSKGNTYTKIANDLASTSTLSMFYAKNITGGASHTVSANWNTLNGAQCSIVAQEFAGCDAVNPLDKFTSAAGTSTTPSSGATAATTQASELVVGGLSHALTATTISLGSGYTNLTTVAGAGAHDAQESLVVSSTGAQTATFGLLASRDWVCGVATFKAATANPLVAPLDSAWQAGGRYWHLYGDAADASARTWQSLQRNYISDPNLLGAAVVAVPPAGARPVPGRDYGEVPQQRAYVSDPSLLATAELENELLGGGDASRHAAVFTDRREVPAQRVYTDLSLLGPAELENELLGGADTSRHNDVAASNGDRREVPQQRAYFDLSLLASAELENELLGSADIAKRHQAATHADRRLVAQQRDLKSDQSSQAGNPPFDPLLAAWLPRWQTHNVAAMFVDRREVPQQLERESDPSLYMSALLENELLGGGDTARHTAMFMDRRAVPTQRVYTDLSLLTSAELENELLGGADAGKRYAAPVTHGPRWWTPQQPKREATSPGLLDTAELENALLGGADVARHTLVPARYDRRLVPQQPKRESVPGLLDTAELENELLGGGDTARRYLQPAEMVDRRETVGWQSRWPDPTLLAPPVNLDPTLAGWAAIWQVYNTAAERVDRRGVPQQRPYISDPSFYPTIAPIDPLTVAWGAGGPYWLLYNTATLQVNRREVPQQRSYVSDPTLLLTALIENELLGGAETTKRYNLPASNGDRRFVPQQRTYLSDPSLMLPLVDPTLAGWPAAWLTHNAAALFVDRREVPQQRLYVSDPSSYPVDPLIFAWGAGGTYWLIYNGAALNVSRRLVPQQPLRVSDPGLLLSALLENELLGGGDASRHAAVFTDRRQTGGYQPRWPGPGLNIPATDPLTVAAGVGGDLWRRYNTATTNADRRETATQPVRLYIDAGPLLPPLGLAWGAGGGYWHRYNRAWQLDQRPWTRWASIIGAPHTCIVLRPATGITTRPGTGITVYILDVTTRPGTGTTPRPDTGTTVDPC